MNEPIRIESSAAAARLQAAERIVITTHARADGDALGSAAGLRRALQALGKEADVYLHEPVLPRYRFLPDMKELKIWDLETAAEIMQAADLLVVVDTCAAIQIGAIAEIWTASETARLAIDHHKTREGIVQEAWVDDTSGACCEMIYRLCHESDWPIDEDLAHLLYAGMATDTGWFRFSNADARCYEAAGALVACGVKPNELYEELYMSDPAPRLRLLGEVLRSFELLADEKLAVIRIDRAMLKRVGATGKMTEELINEPQRIGSVVAALLFVEPYEGDGPIRVSFRSKHDVDVSAVARMFGGGGHERAAGAKLFMSLDEAYKHVTATMIGAVQSATKDRT